MIERLPGTNPSVSRTGGTLSSKTVGILVTDQAEVGGFKVTGEVEPGHDPLYERQSITLERDGDGDYMTNAHDVEFRTSLAWPGPMAAFVVYNDEGVITHRYDVTEHKQMIPGDYVLNLRKGAGRFKKYRREG